MTANLSARAQLIADVCARTNVSAGIAAETDRPVGEGHLTADRLRLIPYQVQTEKERAFLPLDHGQRAQLQHRGGISAVGRNEFVGVQFYNRKVRGVEIGPTAVPGKGSRR